ncbi:MAG: hypothetical protein ACTSX9_08755 [Candidatus Njordarchaeales archaeon]
MSVWENILGKKDQAIGEVAGTEGGIIEIFVYPEHFSKIRVGSILIIDSENQKPMGLVLKLAHSSRYGTFTPMKMTRTEISNAYPDIERYHLFVSTIAYTSYLDDANIVRHGRAGPPKLHDLVYLIKSSDFDALLSFFRPNNKWDFTFLGYFFAEGATKWEFRDFLLLYRDFFKRFENEKDNILQTLIRAISRAKPELLSALLEEISEILGW